MTIIKLKQNKQIAKILHEWALDCKQTDNVQDCGWYTALSIAFKSGSNINDDAIQLLKDKCNAAQDAEKMFKDMIGTQVGDAVVAIAAEARLILEQIND